MIINVRAGGLFEMSMGGISYLVRVSWKYNDTTGHLNPKPPTLSQILHGKLSKAKALSDPTDSTCGRVSSGTPKTYWLSVGKY